MTKAYSTHLTKKILHQLIRRYSQMEKYLKHLFYFECFRDDWPYPSNIKGSVCRKNWCLSALKINSIPHFIHEKLQRFCKLLILGSLNLSHHAHQQKKHLHPSFFIEALQRYCKLLILSTLSIPDCVHQKRWYKATEKFDVYLQAKCQIYSSRPSGNIASRLQTCYFGYFLDAWPRPPKITNKTCMKL